MDGGQGRMQDCYCNNKVIFAEIGLYNGHKAVIPYIAYQRLANSSRYGQAQYDWKTQIINRGQFWNKKSACLVALSRQRASKRSTDPTYKPNSGNPDCGQPASARVMMKKCCSYKRRRYDSSNIR